MTGSGTAGSLFFPLALDGDWVDRLARIVDGYGDGGKPLATDAQEDRFQAPCPRLQPLRAALRRIALANGRLRLAHWRLLYQRQYMFAFRITLAADEMDQWIAHVLIDPVSERPCALPVDPGWAPFPLWGAAAPETAPGALPGDRYAVGRLYRRAQALLPRVIGPRWRSFCASLDARRRSDKERIDGYYRAVQAQREEERGKFRRTEQRLSVWRALWGDPLFDREIEKDEEDGGGGGSHAGSLVFPGAGSPAGGGGGLDGDSAGDVEDEWRRRLEELELRYRPCAQAELAYGAVVMVPCLEVHWRLAHPRRRDVVVCYDFVRGDWLDWRCEACERPLGKAGGEPPPRVLADGSLYCSDCCATCAGCGKPFLPGHAGGLCHLCGEPLCAACCHPCSLDAVVGEARGLALTGARREEQVASRTPRAACPRCRKDWCPTCLALAYGPAGAGLTAPAGRTATP